MFDAVVFSQGDGESAARTLSTLVEGVVEGMLGRMTVVSFQPSPDLLKLGDAAGCRVLAGLQPSVLRTELSKCLETPHILAFSAGALLPPGWPMQLRTEIASRGMPGSGVAVPFSPQTSSARFRMILRHAVRGRFSLDYGALVPRDSLLDGGFDGKTVKHKGPVQMAQLTSMRIL